MISNADEYFMEKWRTNQADVQLYYDIFYLHAQR